MRGCSGAVFASNSRSPDESLTPPSPPSVSRSALRAASRDPDAAAGLKQLQDLGNKLTDCKRRAPFFSRRLPRPLTRLLRSIIREYEKEARADGEEAASVQAKKSVRPRAARPRLPEVA